MNAAAGRRGSAGEPPRGGRLGGIEEPATLITDWVLAACAGMWAAWLMSNAATRGAPGVPTLVWGVAFAATAVGAFAGGVVHGFQRRMGVRWARPLWRATLHLVALASAAFLAATVLVFPDSTVRAVGLGAAGLKLIAVSWLLARAPRFAVVLADSLVTLAAALALQGAAWWSHGAASAPWVFGGLGLSVVAGAIQAFRLAPHEHFNHNDLYHVVQIGALWLLYRGGLLLVVL
jgi:hypothetical protein